MDQKQQKPVVKSGKKLVSDRKRNPKDLVNDVSSKPRKPKTEAQRARDRARRKRRRLNKKNLLNADLTAQSSISKVSDASSPDIFTNMPPAYRNYLETEEKSDDFAPESDKNLGENLKSFGAEVSENSENEEKQELPASEMNEGGEISDTFDVEMDGGKENVDTFTDESSEIRDLSVSESGRAEEMLSEKGERPETFVAETGEADESPETFVAETDEADESPETFVAETNEADENLELPAVREVKSNENEINKRRLEEAEKLSSSLLEEADMLTEIPQKQGILGKLFDLIEKITKKRVGIKVFSVSVIKLILKIFIVFLFIIIAFWAGSSLKVFDFFNNLFNSPSSELPLYKAEESVFSDPQTLRKFGFETSRIAGLNLGNAADMTYNVFFNANYFGLLSDYSSVSETGITAALYYGFNKDVEYIRNRFIFYVKFLSKLNNNNKVKISNFLNGKVQRDVALDEFIKETESLFENGNVYRKEIALQIDELKISINSLNSQKSVYENDFFFALENVDAEKSDMLIHKFIDSSQKQVDLKAKLGALTKLYKYYEDSLTKMKIRLEAIKKNRSALVEGIEVVDTPGVDLGLIQR